MRRIPFEHTSRPRQKTLIKVYTNPLNNKNTQGVWFARQRSDWLKRESISAF